MSLKKKVQMPLQGLSYLVQPSFPHLTPCHLPGPPGHVLIPSSLALTYLCSALFLLCLQCLFASGEVPPGKPRPPGWCLRRQPQRLVHPSLHGSTYHAARGLCSFSPFPTSLKFKRRGAPSRVSLQKILYHFPSFPFPSPKDHQMTKP